MKQKRIVAKDFLPSRAASGTWVKLDPGQQNNRCFLFLRQIEFEIATAESRHQHHREDKS
jgi:hypothetical protein